MLLEINVLSEVLFIFTSVFLVERYVFLEMGLEKRKQQLFYLINTVLLLAIYVLLGKTAAAYFTLFVGGLNISLTRKEHRIGGFLLIIPIIGIVNGLILPILVVPFNLMDVSQDVKLVYGTVFYSLMALFFFIFWIKGKKWRQKFQAEMEYRHIHKWERFQLCLVGILMMVFSNSMSTRPEAGVDNDILIDQLMWNMCLVGICAFVLTVTIIVLIL